MGYVKGFLLSSWIKTRCANIGIIFEVQYNAWNGTLLIVVSVTKVEKQ